MTFFNYFIDEESLKPTYFFSLFISSYIKNFKKSTKKLDVKEFDNFYIELSKIFKIDKSFSFINFNIILSKIIEKKIYRRFKK